MLPPPQALHLSRVFVRVLPPWAEWGSRMEGGGRASCRGDYVVGAPPASPKRFAVPCCVPTRRRDGSVSRGYHATGRRRGQSASALTSSVRAVVCCCMSALVFSYIISVLGYSCIRVLGYEYIRVLGYEYISVLVY